jgi:probable phosphoglycerate mutase
MARLHLIRHAPTAETGTRLTGRLPGVGITDAGKEVAAAAAASLADTELAAVYTSPLLRCRETARIVAAPHGLDPVPYRSLIEVDYGSWAGRSLASLRRTKAWKQILTAPARVRFPGGERIIDMHSRAAAACEELAAVHGRATIAVVGHGDIIKAALTYALGAPIDLYQRITVSPGSISTIDLPKDGEPVVHAINVLPA